MSGSRILALALCLLAACTASAQFPLFGGNRLREQQDVEGSVRIEPADPVVGMVCHFVFTFEAQGSVEIQRIGGLPDAEDGVEYLANTFEPFADNSYRLPVRFTAPLSKTLSIAVSGMRTVERRMGSAFRSTSSSSFQKRFPPLKLDVPALPEKGRPANFSGAVGRRFIMTQKLTPDRVHPGDLVTATYTLRYDGYCPSNAWPVIERLSGEFKAYEPREASRGTNTFVWTQILVPRTTAATNSALVSLSYYNPRTRRYEYARAFPKPLVFVSDKAASTENTSVLVDDAGAGRAASDAPAGTGALTLRFAPSDASPVIATLPASTPVKVLARSNGWRRLETPRAIGWSR